MDIRAEAAWYYDLNPETPDDIAFYRARIPSRDSAVLELGCGTGRVLLPMAAECGYIHGVDVSESMVAICRRKLARCAIPSEKARVQVGDITCLDLDRTFDLITAPYRVFQNLETDADVDGLFDTVRRHLSKSGTCILNTFRPDRDPAALRREWVSVSERLYWEVPIEGGRVTCHVKNARMDPDRMVLYPELTHRRYAGQELLDEAVLKIAMRCYYPDDLEAVIGGHGFDIVERWGGYSGEPYGDGPELVIQFKEAG